SFVSAQDLELCCVSSTQSQNLCTDIVDQFGINECEGEVWPGLCEEHANTPECSRQATCCCQGTNVLENIDSNSCLAQGGYPFAKLDQSCEDICQDQTYDPNACSSKGGYWCPIGNSNGNVITGVSDGANRPGQQC